MAKNVNFKLNGDEFFMMSVSKIMVPLSSPGFLLYVVEFAIVLVTHVKHLPPTHPHLVNVAKKWPLMGFETTFFSGFNQLSCKTTTNLLTFFRVKGSILVRQPKNIDEELHSVLFVFFTYCLNGRNICQVHYIPIMVLVIKLRTYHLLCLFTFIKKIILHCFWISST